MAKRKPPSQRAERQLDPTQLEARQAAEEAKTEAKKALKAERRAEDLNKPTHGLGTGGISGTKSAAAGSQPTIRRSKSGGGG